MNFIDIIRLEGNKGLRKYINEINLKLFQSNFNSIYNQYIKMVNTYIDQSKYKLLISQLSYDGIKRLFKNLVLEYIRNNENLLYKYINKKYPKIKFHCIDTYNYFYDKKKKKKYIFCNENNNIITYKLTPTNYVKTNKKIPFKYTLSQDHHLKGSDSQKNSDIITFIEPITYSRKQSITLFDNCLTKTFQELLELTRDNLIHHIFLSQYNIQEIGHANAIIIDNKNKKIIRLEPLVKEPVNNIKVLINLLIKETNYKYISIFQNLNEKKGLQKTSQTGDWCTIWAYYLSLLYYKNYDSSNKLFNFLIKLEEYNTNFMFYYIFDLLINENIINQELINKLFDRTFKYFQTIKHINNNDFLIVLQYLTDYSMLPQIIRIFDKKEEPKALKIFIKNIHENFDKNSKEIIKNIFKKLIN
jgi:hypothetical protein